jgi:hypothetical protein
MRRSDHSPLDRRQRGLRVQVAALAVLLALPLLPVGALGARAAVTTTSFGTGECTQQVSVTGDLAGGVVADGDDCVLAFKGGSGDWIVPEAVTGIRYLVVGGGGGGGSRGGGGAGAFFETDAAVTVVPGATVSLSVGAGGAAGTATAAGSNGTASGFDEVSAYGGGGGTSSPQYNASSAAGVRPSPPEGTDLVARPVYTAAFVNGEGGSGGGGQASPEHDWYAPTNGLVETQVTALGSDDRGGLGRPAGTAGTGLLRNEGGDSQSILHRFDDGRVRSFWIGGGGGGAGAPGEDAAWASTGESIPGVIAADGQVITLTGPGLVPGAGGAGRASGLVSAAIATTLAVGEVAGEDVYFAGGGAGRANYHDPAEPGEVGNVNLLLTVKILGGAGGVGGGGRATAMPNTGGGGRADAAGASGVVLVRYTRVAQAPFVVTPTSTPGVEPVSLEVSGGSGSGSQLLTLDPDAPCTLSGTTLAPTGGPGSCIVTVSRGGDASYLEREDTFVVTFGAAGEDSDDDDRDDDDDERPTDERDGGSEGGPVGGSGVPVPNRLDTGGGMPAALEPERLMLLLLLTLAVLIALHDGAVAVGPRGRGGVLAGSLVGASSTPPQWTPEIAQPDGVLTGFETLHARLDVLRVAIASGQVPTLR